VTPRTMKNVTDAERQGGEDYKAGRQCRKYKDFLSKYGLFKSDDSLQMWAAYLRPGQQARAQARIQERHKPEILTHGAMGKSKGKSKRKGKKGKKGKKGEKVENTPSSGGWFTQYRAPRAPRWSPRVFGRNRPPSDLG